MSKSASRGIAGTVDVVVIGAGHSGLAMSYLLGQRSLNSCASRVSYREPIPVGR